MRFMERNIVANGVRFNVIVEGAGPDVILLHGFPDSSLIWRNQIPALVQAGYRVIVPDLRGSGESEAPTGRANYKLAILINDVIGLMDGLGIGKARLVGHDWGAILGWHVALAHPERVDRYVAMSVGHPTSYRKGGIEQKVRSWYAYAFQIPVIPECRRRPSTGARASPYEEPSGDWTIGSRTKGGPEGSPPA